MRHILGAIVVACNLIVSVACLVGAEVQVVQNPVPENSFAEVNVTLGKGEQVVWDIYPEPVKVVERSDAVYFSGPVGTKYKVTATIINFETKKLDKKVVWVSVGEGEDVGAATLTGQMKTAFKDETADEKLLAPKFADLYRSYAIQTNWEGASWGELFSNMSEDAKKAGLTGKLLKTQEVVQAYLMKHLPSKDAWDKKITAADAKRAKEAFATVANAWGKLK